MCQGFEQYLTSGFAVSWVEQEVGGVVKTVDISSAAKEAHSHASLLCE